MRLQARMAVSRGATSRAGRIDAGRNGRKSGPTFKRSFILSVNAPSTNVA